MADLFTGIGAVVSTQVLSRALTFLLHVLVARLASPSAYGTPAKVLHWFYMVFFFGTVHVFLFSVFFFFFLFGTFFFPLVLRTSDFLKPWALLFEAFLEQILV